MKKNLIFETIQMLVYVTAYNYLFTVSQPPFKWENFLFAFLPVLIFSGPNYFCYFIARKLLLCRIYNKFITTLAVLMAYVFISFLAFLFVSQILQNDETVTTALSIASIYAPLFILPFLLKELYSLPSYKNQTVSTVRMANKDARQQK